MQSQAPSTSESESLLFKYMELQAVLYEIGLSGNESNAVILDAYQKLLHQKRNSEMDLRIAKSKFDEMSKELHQNRLRVGELLAQYQCTQKELSEWRYRCELAEQNYESLRRLMALASDALAMDGEKADGAGAAPKLPDDGRSKRDRLSIKDDHADKNRSMKGSAIRKSGEKRDQRTSKIEKPGDGKSCDQNDQLSPNETQTGRDDSLKTAGSVKSKKSRSKSKHRKVKRHRRHKKKSSTKKVSSSSAVSTEPESKC